MVQSFNLMKQIQEQDKLINQDYTAKKEQKVVAFSLVLTGLLMLALAPAHRPLQSASVDKNQVIQLTNYERVNNGLNPLAENPLLSQSARLKAQDMIERGYFAHYYEQTTPWEFLHKTGVNDWRFAGENLAKNYDSSTLMVQDWMNSQKHKENILSDSYDEIGVAVVQATTKNGQPVMVTVQLFTGH